MADKGIGEAASLFEKELDALIQRKGQQEKELGILEETERKIETVLSQSRKIECEDIDLKCRDMLLKYYSSECTIHGTYILSTALGVFAFFQVTEKIISLLHNIAFPIIAFILSGFMTISILFIARIIYWGTLSSAITHVQEMTIEDAEKTIEKNRDKITFLLRMHRACIKHFTDYKKTLNYFVGVDRKNKMRSLYVVIFVVFAVALWLVELALL